MLFWKLTEVSLSANISKMVIKWNRTKYNTMTKTNNKNVN